MRRISRGLGSDWLLVHVTGLAVCVRFSAAGFFFFFIETHISAFSGYSNSFHSVDSAIESRKFPSSRKWSRPAPPPPPSPKYTVYRVYSYSGILPKIISRKFEMGLHIHGCIASVLWGPSLWSCKLVVIIWPSCSCLPYIVLSSPSVSSTSRERALCISI